MHKFIALDTETTGVDFCSSQVIQCGALFLDEQLKPTHEEEWNIAYIPEKFSWDTEAEAVHGIAKDTACTHGLTPEQFITAFEREVIKHYGTQDLHSVHIIAANAYFDYLMLDLLWREFRPGYPLPLSRRVMDLSSLSLLVLGFAGMTSVLEALEIPTEKDKRHSALYDARLHLTMFQKLVECGSKKGLALAEVMHGMEGTTKAQ